MSTAHNVTATAGHDAHADGHDPHLAHHFDTMGQQEASGKLGMWVFLGTELLMFGGLFCAYGVYRHNHPDVFEYAHTELNKTLGGINTVVLITSSLTMALAVRCSQLGQKKALVGLLALTLLGGFGFLGIKTIEYKTKWEHHLWIGQSNQYHRDYKPAAGEAGHGEHGAGVGEHGSAAVEHGATAGEHGTVAGKAAMPAVARQGPADADPLAGTPDEPKIKPSFLLPAGMAPEATHGGAGHHLAASDLSKREQERISTFFSIYFLMTGLHGLHVVIGMALIFWVLLRSAKGEFGPRYFAPVDLVGLYWHLVDLIWIFLFPLLYLIH